VAYVKKLQVPQENKLNTKNYANVKKKTLKKMFQPTTECIYPSVTDQEPAKLAFQRTAATNVSQKNIQN